MDFKEQRREAKELKAKAEYDNRIKNFLKFVDFYNKYIKPSITLTSVKNAYISGDSRFEFKIKNVNIKDIEELPIDSEMMTDYFNGMFSPILFDDVAIVEIGRNILEAITTKIGKRDIYLLAFFKED